MKTGFYVFACGASAFVDACGMEERYFEYLAAEQEERCRQAIEGERRTREILRSLRRDPLGKRIGADRVRIQGLRRVSFRSIERGLSNG